MSNKLPNIYHHIKSSPGSYVLATIIETMGSTYQKAGARMLISESGEFTGLLGGGCFESDLNEHAEEVLKGGESKVVFYDMRSPEDAIWGLGLGCNGAVRILLQPLNSENQYSPFDLLTEVIENNKTGTLITICESDHDQFEPGQSFYINENISEDKRTCPDQFVSKARQVFDQTKSQLVEHTFEKKEIKVFYDLLKLPFKLLIIGAGQDAVPLTRLAKILDWHITVVDYREAYLKSFRFPDVDILLNLNPVDLSDGLIATNHFDAVILMTHNMNYDNRYFNIITKSDINYIGLLGPAKRRERLLESLDKKPVNIEDRVFGPTGLDIGAQTPEEIALSVIAEIQSVTRNREGGQLSKKDRPIMS